jgi:hypothetical protein
METFASRARPGTLAYTQPSRFTAASMVTHTHRVASGSLTIVEAVIDENSFV